MSEQTERPFAAWAEDYELDAMRTTVEYCERLAGECARAAGRGMERREALTLANGYLEICKGLRQLLHACEQDRREHGGR